MHCNNISRIQMTDAKPRLASSLKSEQRKQFLRTEIFSRLLILILKVVINRLQIIEMQNIIVMFELALSDIGNQTQVKI